MEESAVAKYQDQGRAALAVEVPHSANVTDISDAPQPRLVGSPLPGGASSHAMPPSAPALHPAEPVRLAQPSSPPPQPARTLAAPPAAQSSGLQRALGALRMAIPYVQKILPLIDGNIATTVSNILAPPRPHAPAPDLAPMIAPIKESLAELQTQQRDLKEQFIEQNASLKRVEDHLELVREATDRNTLEQQELLEDLKSVGNKVNVVAIVAIGLLAVSVLLNMLLYLHIQRILP